MQTPSLDVNRNALARLDGCKDACEPSLPTFVMITEISRATHFTIHVSK